MKKLISAAAAFVMMITMFAFVGCTVTKDQMKIIANQTGLFTVVGWVAVDNPTPEVKVYVAKIAEQIKVNSALVESGESYLNTLYPMLVEYIDSELSEQYRPLAKAGSLALLGGIDLLFAANPSWKDVQDQAIEIVISFCDGAISGLQLKEDSDIMLTAKRNFSMRQIALGK